MNCLPVSKQVRVIGALVEGCSINSMVRMTGVLVGRRDARSEQKLMDDLASRISNRIQLTTYGHRVYVNAVENSFGCAIDYTRYSPATCIDCQTAVISGDPDPEKICTSYIERQNFTMRMGMRRFTRLTTVSAKKEPRPCCGAPFHALRLLPDSQTLRVTPAMEAGLADHVWTIEELCSLMMESRQ
ncbi:MAG TPA: hypothetical protein VG759_13405 [Candidatus Angelobacter sp.]|nr:hypothetical protein [Candidatus Angelobacter sp.]